MSVGAVFKLIANDGKADRMIMATKLLNQRIKDVMCARSAAGKADITPTLVDLERTHILYVNAHFKPYAAIGYEYNKVRPQSGSTALGTGVTFSIPQFGDFFYDMVCRVRLGACRANKQLTPLQAGTGGPNSTAVFPCNIPATDIQAGYYYNLVDLFGNVIVPGTTAGGATTGQVQYSNLVEYCNFPGNRLFRTVKFDVNGNPLDSYDEMVPVMLEKFCTPKDKRDGYNRLIGQENPISGYGNYYQTQLTDYPAAGTPQGVIARNNTGQSNQTVQAYTAGALPGANGTSAVALGSTSAATVLAGSLLNLDTAASTATSPWGSVTPQYEISRERRNFTNGPQTPKPVQPALEIWNKLRFWFNDDVRLSIPSVSIPFGQRFITIELAPATDIIFDSAPNTLWLETIIDNGAVALAGGPQNTTAPLATSNAAGPFGPSSGNGTFGIQNGAYSMRTKTYKPIYQSAGIVAPEVTDIELYINNIFVNPEVHDIYIKRIGFSLIRVYRQQKQRSTYGTGEMLLSNLKWPIEYMFIGARPTWNVSKSNPKQAIEWNLFTHQITGLLVDPDLSEAPIRSSDTTSYNTGIAPAGSRIDRPNAPHYFTPVSAIDNLALTSHGIVIFDNFSDIFYNSYMPFHYGGTALNTPEDTGAFFVNMAVFPRAYQPSGHLNVSRARETYLKWTSTYISESSPVDFTIVAVAINFLLITDGSAVLRYST
jgi:hypothetical protein